MELVCVLIGLELLLLVAVRRRIAKNQRLQDELRRCHTDLANALAHLSTFAPGFDPVGAQRIVQKWRIYEKPPPPLVREPTRLH
jgi:hypothetical protein